MKVWKGPKQFEPLALHHPAYRAKYEVNLKREFPRLPFYEDFRQWAGWGRALMELHLGFYNIHLDENQKINLAFPWWVDQLHVNKDTSELRNSPEKWIRGRICGTNSATSKLAAIYCLIFASLLLCHFNYPSSSH